MITGRLGVLIKALLVCGAVVAIDQLTKGIVREQVTRGDSADVLPFLKISNTRNSGVAFGFLSDGGTIVAVVAAAALAALLIFFATHLTRPLVWLPTGLLIGGAAGNLIDRAAEGSVTDFIDPPFWPAFNVADMAITIGVLTLLYVLEGPPSRGTDRRD